jgi:hypothetical protein
MAVTLVTTTMAAGVNYTVITDSSADWILVPISIYFYDKITKFVYYKNADGHISIVTATPVKQNLSAITDPTVNDDAGDFYSQGSFWYNTSTNKLWVCMNNTLTLALWKLLTLTDNDGNVVLPGGLQFSGGFGTANLTANTDNLLITGLASSALVRLTSAGNFQLTGIVVPDTTKAYFFSIFNVGLTGNITFKNDDAGSTAENRFLLGSDVLVQPGEGLTFIYDPVDLRWRSPGKNI